MIRLKNKKIIIFTIIFILSSLILPHSILAACVLDCKWLCDYCPFWPTNHCGDGMPPCICSTWAPSEDPCEGSLTIPPFGDDANCYDYPGGQHGNWPEGTLGYVWDSCADPTCSAESYTAYYDPDDDRWVTCSGAIESGYYAHGGATPNLCVDLNINNCGDAPSYPAGDNNCEAACGADSFCDEMGAMSCPGGCAQGVAQRVDCCSDACNFYDDWCASVCGAHADCNLKFPGDSCGTGKTCKADCSCTLDPCDGYSNQGECTANECKWCNKCSGTKTNTWETGKCVDTATDCGYHCVEGECGAECDSNGDCPGTETCDSNCECQSGATCPSAVCGGYCGDYGAWPDWRYYNLCGTDGDYSGCTENNGYPFCGSACIYDNTEFCPLGCSGGSCQGGSPYGTWTSCKTYYGYDNYPDGFKVDNVFWGHVYLNFHYWSDCPNWLYVDCEYENGDEHWLTRDWDAPNGWTSCYWGWYFWESYNPARDSNGDGKLRVYCDSNGGGDFAFYIIKRPSYMFYVTPYVISGTGSSPLTSWVLNRADSSVSGVPVDQEGLGVRIEYGGCAPCTGMSGNQYTVPGNNPNWDSHGFTLTYTGSEPSFWFTLYGREYESCSGWEEFYMDVEYGYSIQFEEICDNGIDDDGDSLIDCNDPDCLGEDTNGDGYVDCCNVNADCTPNRNCVNEACSSNYCQYPIRSLCENVECAGTEWCDGTNTDCVTPDDDNDVCETCFGGNWDYTTGGECCEYNWGAGDDWCHTGVVGNPGDSCVGVGVWHSDHCQDTVSNCDELTFNITTGICDPEIDCGFGGGGGCVPQSVCGPCCVGCECIDITLSASYISTKTLVKNLIEIRFSNMDTVSPQPVEVYLPDEYINKLQTCFGKHCEAWDYSLINDTGEYIGEQSIIVTVLPSANQENLANFTFTPSGPTPVDKYEIEIGVRNIGEESC